MNASPDLFGKVKTTCPYCGVGCGLIVETATDGQVSLSGDPDHPANLGRICSKGAALGETLSLDGRLLHPLIGGKRSEWDDALDLVASRFKAAIDRYGPDSVAFYVSGQLTTEDYYVANKLMKGFIGSANIDTNSRLCMASSVAGHKRAFGSDTVPGCYEDLELANLVVLVGSNLAWCHPVLYQRLAEAREKRRTKVVVIDPRRTATCDIADLHLPIAPGADVALFNGLLAHLEASGSIVTSYVHAHTKGLDEALGVARPWSLSRVAEATGLVRSDIEAFYELFAKTAYSVTVYSQGVNQSASGTDKVNAILNCHLATGRIGRPGMGPFSVTGQPNAMGGREVGGLANQLAAHMELESWSDRRRVSRFWGVRKLSKKPGLKAVELFEAVHDDRIKAIWIMGTNPVASLPNADRVRDALLRCDFVVVSDVERHTDTTETADVLLPSAAWGEKAGTVTNSERRVSRQRPFMTPPGDARPDWWQLSQVGRRMGFEHAFDYGHPFEILNEHARLSGLENGGARDFDISGIGDLTRHDYEVLAPFQWPLTADKSRQGGRFFSDGGFYTADGRAQFVPTPHADSGKAKASRYSLTMNTGRIRDQWHTMTRSGRSGRLMQHFAEPYVEIHPADANEAGVADANLVTVESPHGLVTVRALLTKSQRPGSVFVPIHWTGAHAATGRVDALVPPRTDPVSGQPDSKRTAVSIRPFRAAWYGFLVVRDRPETISAEYWAVARANEGWRVELAGQTVPDDWTALAAELIECEPGEITGSPTYCAADRSEFRTAVFDGKHLQGAFFASPGPVAVSRSWGAGLLAQAFEDNRSRSSVLAGRGADDDAPDKGATICACFAVGINQIAQLRAGGPTTVEEVGWKLGAGTNCGSCRPEIQRIIDAAKVKESV